MISEIPPVVSVMMPTFNRAHLIPTAIASVLEQDFKDLELVVVDDGSRDETEKVIREIQKQDDRLRYVRLPENRGIGMARDTALHNSRGRFIGFADSDDLWLPGKLGLQVGFMEKYSRVDMLFGDFWNLDHRNEERRGNFALGQRGLAYLQTEQVEEHLWIVNSGMEYGLLVKMFIQLGTVLLRSEILKNTGGFNRALSGPEDFEFCWRAAVCGVRYAYTDHKLVERHVGETSITANREKSWRNVIDALRVCRETIRQAQRSELLPVLRDAEQNAFRHLILAYGSSGRRNAAWKAYQDSLHSSYSTRTLVGLLVALGGPRAVRGLKKRLGTGGEAR